MNYQAALASALFLAVAPFAASSFAAQKPADGPKAKTPEVWILHGDWKAFVAEDAHWDFLKKNLDGFGFYIDGVRPPQLPELKKLVAELHENKIKVAIECGGVLEKNPIDDTVGKWTADLELEKMKVFADAGGKIDYLTLDGPVRRLMNDPIHEHHKPHQPMTSLDAAVDQMIISMRETRKAMPNVQFFYGANFQNYAYKHWPAYVPRKNNTQGWGDFFPVIQAVIKKTREAGIPIQGLAVDAPYDYLLGEVPVINPAIMPDPKAIDWMGRVRDLEDYVKSQGIEFNLMVNSQTGGMTSDEQFCKDTLAYVDAYRAAGGNPTRYFVQTWYPYPKKVAAEDEPYSMAYLVKEIIKRVKGDKQGDAGAPSKARPAASGR